MQLNLYQTWNKRLQTLYFSDGAAADNLGPIRLTSTSGSKGNTVVLKGKHQKKNVSDNLSMDSFTKIYIDSEKLWPKIRELDLFQLTLQNDAKKP